MLPGDGEQSRGAPRRSLFPATVFRIIGLDVGLGTAKCRSRRRYNGKNNRIPLAGLSNAENRVESFAFQSRSNRGGFDRYRLSFYAFVFQLAQTRTLRGTILPTVRGKIDDDSEERGKRGRAGSFSINNIYPFNGINKGKSSMLASLYCNGIWLMV